MSGVLRFVGAGAKAGFGAIFRKRTGPLVALIAAAAAWPQGSARAAEDETRRCVEAYTDAQRQRKATRLRAALERLVVCSQPSCPGFIRGDCTQWHAEVDAALPSVIIDARDGLDRDVIDVRVSDGDQPITDRLEGVALALDPGEHRLRFERQGQVEERSVLLREGEKRRRIEVRFAGPRAPSAPASSSAPAPTPPRPAGFRRSPPAASWGLGGAGLLALGTAAVLGFTQKQQLAHLRETCAPACEKGDLDQVKRLMLVADVTAGVGALSLGVGLLLWGLQPPGRVGVGPGGASWVVRF